MLSLLGISLVLLNSKNIFLSVKIIGALYLFYLGAKFILQVWNTESILTITSNKKGNTSNIKSFIDGFLTQILNPKVSMFYIAAFPQFIDFSGDYYHIQGLILTTVHAFTIALWFIFMTLFIDNFSKLNENKVANKTVMYISGSFLVYFSLLLILQPLPNLQEKPAGILSHSADEAAREAKN